jgi:hypothetical protein
VRIPDIHSGALALALVLLPAAGAQSRLTEHTLGLDDPARSPRASIEDVAWLAGRWRGEGLGGVVEELWSPPLAGAMVGVFRLVADGEPSFYEICLLREHEGSLVYRVKHFHADLSGWEERSDFVEFPLVKLEPGLVQFAGLTLSQAGDACVHYLAMRQGETHVEAAIEYRRVREPEAQALPASAPPAPVSLALLEPLIGAWGPPGAEEAGQVVHDYAWTAGGEALRLREGYRAGEADLAELDGLVFCDPAGAKIEFVAVAGHGAGAGRTLRGEYRPLPGGAIERIYDVTYRTPADAPGAEQGGLSRRFREVYTVDGERLEVTRELWRDGAWQPFGDGPWELVRR